MHSFLQIFFFFRWQGSFFSVCNLGSPVSRLAVFTYLHVCSAIFKLILTEIEANVQELLDQVYMGIRLIYSKDK